MGFNKVGVRKLGIKKLGIDEPGVKKLGVKISLWLRNWKLRMLGFQIIQLRTLNVNDLELTNWELVLGVDKLVFKKLGS